MKAPKVLIKAIKRGQDTQDHDCCADPTGILGGKNLSDEKKNRCIADQIKKEIAADGIVNGVEGIKNGQNKKDRKGKRKTNSPDLQRPFCYPFIEPEEKSPA